MIIWSFFFGEPAKTLADPRQSWPGSDDDMGMESRSLAPSLLQTRNNAIQDLMYFSSTTVDS